MTLSLLTTLSCKRESVFDDEFDPRWSKEPGTSFQLWDFLNSGDYSYDSNFIEISNGKASLKTVGQNFSGTDFNSGTHAGTYFSEGSLTLNPSQVGKQLDSSWAPEWNNLNAYWKMDESSWSGVVNEVIDSSNNANHGVRTGTASTSSTAQINSSATFPTTTSSVTVTGSDVFLSSPNSPITISAWINPNTIGTNPGVENSIFTIRRSTGASVLWVGLGNTNKFKFYGYSGSGGYEQDSNASIATGIWTHVALTYDGTCFQIYINGAKDGTCISQALDSGSSSYAAVIGSYDSSSFNFDGYIDELAIWGSGLSDQQVLSLYFNQLGNYSTEFSSSWTPHWDKIVGYWSMNGNWQDSSGNKNHGSANGNASFDTKAQVGNLAGAFDGSADYIEVTNQSLFDPSIGDFTVMAWTNCITNATRDIVSQQDGTGTGRSILQIGGTGTFSSYLGGAARDSGVTALCGRWYHVAFSYDSTANVLQWFIDGEVQNSFNFTPESATGKFIFGAGKTFTSNYWDGLIDEVAIFQEKLSYSDVLQIYDRQKQKYAGHYDSPVIDLGVSGSWTSLGVATTLPFGKEILSQASETSLNYSLISGDLSNGLIGYYNFNNNTQDLSSNSNDGTILVGQYAQDAILGSHSVYLQPGNNQISFPLNSSNKLGTTKDGTFSLWVKWQDEVQASFDILSRGQMFFRLVKNNTTDKFAKLQVGIQTGGTCLITSSEKIDPQKWTHVAFTLKRDSYCDTDLVNLFINGKKDTNTSRDSNTTTTDVDFEGADLDWRVSVNNSAVNYQGNVDELAIWQRALTDIEINQIYRRSGNRLKYQVKSCIDSSCNCRAYSSSPTGSASDCDGDGVPNSADANDTFKAKFIGPGGDESTSYSELYNRDQVNLTFSCSDNNTDSDANICVNDEITITGDSKPAAPNFTFTNMSASASLPDNRFFQFRVLMEAEENSSCSGQTCLPQVSSLNVSPTNRYYGGRPVIRSLNPLAYSSLNSISFTEGGSCSLTYQLSGDSSTYYYHNGSAWVVAGSEDSSLSSLASSMVSNIKSFPALSGNLYFKAFLTSDTTQPCEIDQISIENP